MSHATLTATDLDEFRSQGYVVVSDLFDAAECEQIAGHIEAAAFELDLGDPAEGPLSYRPMMHLASPPLTAVATDPRWAPIVLPLLGTGDARLYWEQAVVKPPQARTELPWHQDNGYTPLIPEEYLTCWLALDDAEVANGCLWVIPGSHRHGTVRHHGGAGPFRVGHDGPDADGVPVPVARGSVLVFSSLLMHRSGPNTTDRGRRAWIIQYCGRRARSALSNKLLDDRLLCAREGSWLDEPVRERDFDLLAVLANYDQR
jgi:hypothetical protein